MSMDGKHLGAASPLFMVLDTGAFISGVSQQLPGTIVTTPLVLQEVKSQKARAGLDRLQAASRLRVVKPPNKALKSVKAATRKTQDHFVISQADIEILALAFHYHNEGMSMVLISDDYAVQNLAKKKN